MQAIATLFNAAGALFFAYGALMGASESLESFQAGNIVGGLAPLPIVAFFGLLAVACAHFALYGEG